VDASGGDRSTVVNNFVSVSGRYGLSLQNPIDLDVYHNSVCVNNDYFDTRAFECTSPYSYSNINVINNNFASMEAGYAYHVLYSTAINLSDNNNLYTPGNYIAYRDSNIIDLEKLQTVSGKNLNSLSVYPHYTSDTDLHTMAPWLDNKGTNLNYVTRDIDGENRDPITPDIGADEFSSNPTSTPYSNDLTVGSGGDFVTINEAIDSLLLRGVTDSIHINIYPAVYFEQVDLLPIPGASNQNIITFQTDPAATDTAEIRFVSFHQDSNYTLRLKGADNIKIKNLKLAATGEIYGRVVDLYRGVNNLYVENCMLEGILGSGADASKILLFSQDSYYQNREIRNNEFRNGTYGIYMRREQNNFLHAQNPVIKNNRFNNIGYCGVYLQFTDYAILLENEINADSYGIFIISSDNRLHIRKNKIVVEHTCGIRLSSCFALPGLPTTIINNFISVGSLGDAYGINLNNSYSIFVFHNSVNVTSIDVNDGRAFYINSGAAFGISLYNNIFKNSGGGYSYYVENIGAISSSDYNDLYTTGSVLAYWLGGRTDLAALQAAGEIDMNSVSADPVFVSDTDLHTTAAVLDSAAIYMGVAEDIDGQLRDQTYPDIGADEFGYFANRDPIITSNPYIIAQVDSLYEYQVIANDPDGDSLFYYLNTAAGFLSIDSISGLISGIPTINDTGQFNIQIEVHDRRGGVASQQYLLHVISLPAFTVSIASYSLTDVSYGSVAWGDYDNDGDLDIALVSRYFSTIYRNDSGIFTDIQANIQTPNNSNIDWGDYDNDGDLDLAITGSSYERFTKIYRNDSGQFIEIMTNLEQISAGDIVWGDYDNDGDLDIALTGSSASGYFFDIYKNINGSFVATHQNLMGYTRSSLECGDYDNDGDLDILYTGYNSEDFEKPYTGIYRNNNGTFSKINLGGVNKGCAKWGDYDNDGDLDIVSTGEAYYGNPSTIILRNDDNTYTLIDANIKNLENSSADWGDYDNDGDLDLIISGSNFGYYTKIYRNDSGIFIDINAGLEGINNGTLEWGDYDNDGDLDVLMTGEYFTGNPYYLDPLTRIYDNNLNIMNTPPSNPQNTMLQFNGNEFTLNWDASNDQETPQSGLTYNLRIGSSPGGSEIKSAMSNSDGYRQIVDMGNINHITSWPLSNISSNIFWSVQAVDHGFTGSPFSEEDSIILAGLIYKIVDVPNDQGGKVSIRWQASELDNNVNTLQHYSIWRAIPVTKDITKKQESEEVQISSTQKEKNKYTEINGEIYYWEWVADQPAHRLPYYSYTCETLYDSMSTTNGLHYFMISAHTDDPNVFFDSNPDSGYSVDNIAPMAPANLNGLYNNNQITLHWNPNNESDFKEYVLYRSISPNINPATDTVFTTTTDTTFTDTNPIPASDIYYIVCAKDIHDNLSQASNEVEILITGILKDGLEIPKTYALYQNFPNPFNPYTIIKFDLPKSSKVVVTIFNSLGKNVATVVNEPLSPGKYQYMWKPDNLASGLYLYAIQMEDFRSVKKMLLVK
jgi:hypothetical protein